MGYGVDMSNAAWWEFLIMIPATIFGSYAMVWSIPAVIMSAVVSLGSLRHIIFIDKQLAKNLDKYYDNNGYMRPQYQMSWAIGSRCFNYWFMYPFIRNRANTDSRKFKFFMWINALGMWSWVGVFVCVTLAKYLGIKP